MKWAVTGIRAYVSFTGVLIRGPLVIGTVVC
jgi:hypothetical protein